MRDETAGVNWAPPQNKVLKWFRRKVAATVTKPSKDPAGGTIGDQYGAAGNAEAIRSIPSLGVIRKIANVPVEKERSTDVQEGGNV